MALWFVLLLFGGSYATIAVVAPDRVVIQHLRDHGYLQLYAEDVENIGDIVHLEERDLSFMWLGSDKPFVFDRNIIDRNFQSSRTVLNYLDNFGYLDAILKQGKTFDYLEAADQAADIGSVAMISIPDIEQALRLFQSTNGLNVSGVVDGDVMSLMKVPRCGAVDINPQRVANLNKTELLGTNHGNRSLKAIRQKRFVTTNEKWTKSNLTFFIENHPKHMDPHQTRSEIVLAFGVWLQHINMSIIEVEDSTLADIHIKFVSKFHGDRWPFDGPSGILAHAFYPKSGEIHFDDDEKFLIGTEYGVSLYYTAAHEFGHTLGLEHSFNHASLMSPYYPGLTTTSTILVKDDDKEGIQDLYPAGQGEVISSEDERAKMYEDKLRNNGQVDGSLSMRIDGSCIDQIDAAFTYKSHIYFFTGEKFYDIKDVGEMHAYKIAIIPKLIREHWDGLPGNIDAAFANSSIDVAYFFKGELYWKFDLLKGIMFSGFPKKFSPLVPTPLRAIMSLNASTIFYGTESVWIHENNFVQLKREPNPSISLDIIDAAFPHFVDGFYSLVHGSMYTVYRVKDRQPVRVYDSRPLSWDFGLPMCIESLSGVDTKANGILCDAYMLLGRKDGEIKIPEICYYILQRFDVISLSDLD